MKRFDAVVIGGGVLGCFAARSLTRYRLAVALIESEPDVCRGLTRANSAIVYAGYDHRPGSRKAQMTVRANASFAALCETLDVPFSRCGSLMTACGPNAKLSLRKKFEQGKQNGVPSLRLLDGDEARAIEPMLSERVTMALYAPSTGTVNPWALGIAAFENARQNGCRPLLQTKVTAIRPVDGGYRIETTAEELFASVILNCAGLHAVSVQELCLPSPVQLRLDGADYLVFDPLAPRPTHIVFAESEAGKGITATPCVEGNLLLDSPPRPYAADFASTKAGLDAIHAQAKALLPALDFTRVIRSFGAIRPNPVAPDGRDVRDFCIAHPADGFWSLIGVKTPGLTAANELGTYLADQAAAFLNAKRNDAFDPVRKGIVSQPDSPIVCRCMQVTEDAVRQAMARGARTPDGVKHRVGSGMGRCQGSRCAYAVERLLKEGIDVDGRI